MPAKAEIGRGYHAYASPTARRFSGSYAENDSLVCPKRYTLLFSYTKVSIHVEYVGQNNKNN